MPDLELQCEVIGLNWIQSRQTVKITLEVKEIEEPKYPYIMKLRNLPFTVRFSAANVGTGRRDGKPTEAMTEGQRKLLWKIFSHAAILKFYDVTTKEDAKDKFKKRVGFDHIADIPKEAVSKAIDAMVREIQKTDPKFNTKGETK